MRQVKPNLYEYRIDSAWCIECQIGRMRLKVSRALTFIGFHFSLECRVLHWSLFNQQISTVITWWPILRYFVKLGKKYGYYLMPYFPNSHINLDKSTVFTLCQIYRFSLPIRKKKYGCYLMPDFLVYLKILEEAFSTLSYQFLRYTLKFGVHFFVLR
jgi:hypothetical protein